MATKKRLKIRDKQGDLVDFDISSASVTIDAEGKSLDMKLSELVRAIADSIKSVTYNGEPKTPNQAGNIVIRQEQPNWNESNDQHPSYIQGKPNSVVNEILYDQQTRMLKQRRNGSVENVFTIPDGGTTMAPDTEMSGTSENAVQNKVIKAYVDAVSQRIDQLVSTGNVQGVIDTFNEIKAFLANFSESDTLVVELYKKVDKENGKSLMTDAEHGKLANLPTASELNTTFGTKADKSTTYTKTDADNKFATKSEIPTLPQNIVQSIIVNGTPHTPTEGVVDLGNLRGQDGNSGVASADNFESVNNLNGGTIDTSQRVYVLGANQGKRLRDQIGYVYARLQAVYAALGNIAFWDGKPASATILPNLDWGMPKHTLTLNLTLSNASVKVNGTAYTNGNTLSVEEYSTLSVLIEAASGHTFATAPTLTFGGQSVALTANQDGSYSAEVAMGQSDVTMAVSASAVVMYSISYSLSNCSAPSGVTNPTSVLQGGTSTIRLTAQSGYALPSSLPSGAVVGASVSSWDGSTGTLVISNVTGNVTISVSAVQLSQVNVTMKKVTGYGAQLGAEGNPIDVASDDWTTDTKYTDGAYMTLGNLSPSTPECSLSNVNYIDGSPFSAFVIPSAGYGIFSVKVEQNGQDITDNAYTPANRSINVVSANSTLAITVIVCAATNSLFMGGSFFGVQGGMQNLFEPQKCGQIVTDPDWCCMSEFVPVPANATHIRWWLGDNEHLPYDEPVGAGSYFAHRRCLVFFADNLVAGRAGNYNDWTKPYRDYNMSTFSFTPKYVRASFKTSLLQYAKIQFSTDGVNFTDAWVYSSNN